MTKEEIKKQIYQINYYYLGMKLMGPIYGDIFKNHIETIEDGSILIGFVVFDNMKKYDRIMMKKIAIRDEFRKKGYGTQLLERLKKYNKDIQANVSQLNKEAQVWYIKNGFEKIKDNRCTSTFLWSYHA